MRYRLKSDFNARKYPNIPGIRVMKIKSKSAKERPMAVDSPSRENVRAPIDSLSPRPDIVMGIFPIKMINGKVKTAVQRV